MTQKLRAYTSNSDLGSNFPSLPTTVCGLEHFASLSFSLLIFMKMQWDCAHKNPALAHSISSIHGNGHSRCRNSLYLPSTPSIDGRIPCCLRSPLQGCVLKVLTTSLWRKIENTSVYFTWKTFRQLKTGLMIHFFQSWHFQVIYYFVIKGLPTSACPLIFQDTGKAESKYQQPRKAGPAHTFTWCPGIAEVFLAAMSLMGSY